MSVWLSDKVNAHWLADIKNKSKGPRDNSDHQAFAAEDLSLSLGTHGGTDTYSPSPEETG